MRKRFSLLLIFFISFVSQSSSQKYDSDVFYGREFRSEGDTLRYRILYPEGYDKKAKEKYPLVIFLHGRGESGTDNQAQLKYGASLFMYEETKRKYPAIVIFPQCPEEELWAEYNKSEDGIVSVLPDPEQTGVGYILEKLIKHYMKSGKVDSKRVYILGLSMGGMGTLDMVVRNPKMFAAAISICGAIEPTRLKKLKKMPIRFYHGTEDPIVPVSYSRDAFYELKAEGSSVAEIIEYPGIGHDSWNLAFSSGDFLEWLFSHKR